MRGLLRSTREVFACGGARVLFDQRKTSSSYLVAVTSLQQGQDYLGLEMLGDVCFLLACVDDVEPGKMRDE